MTPWRRDTARRRYSISRHAVEKFEEVLIDGFGEGLAFDAVGKLAHEPRAGQLQRNVPGDHLHEHVRHRERFRGRGQRERASDRRGNLLILPLAGLFKTAVRAADEYHGTAGGVEV